jgi:hypothetical protein
MYKIYFLLHSDSGLYIGKYPHQGGNISCHLGGKIVKERREKGGKVKEKGRKGKENEKKGSKRVK